MIPTGTHPSRFCLLTCNVSALATSIRFLLERFNLQFQRDGGIIVGISRFAHGVEHYRISTTFKFVHA